MRFFLENKSKYDVGFDVNRIRRRCYFRKKERIRILRVVEKIQNKEISGEEDGSWSDRRKLEWVEGLISGRIEDNGRWRRK
jgi:hypothetical protein